jgi:glycine dehydrogenase subunit 2
VAGFKVITLMPGPMGYAEVDALKAALSERTAGLMLTNPEDTGQFNPRIREFVDLVHAAGGLCAYDQANGNPLLGIARAGDAGFDLCQFNLHKTFSAPHSAVGQGCAAVGVKAPFRPFLPRPVVTFDGTRYGLDYGGASAIDRIRAFLGNVQTVLKAYAWVMSLGAEGLRAAAETAVLNNNYMLHRVRTIPGVAIPYPANAYPKLEQVRYSWEPLTEETGVTSSEIEDRLVDYGVQHYMTSHVPMLVPQPFTLEPGESLTIEEMDAMVEALRSIAAEARENPDLVRGAPHNASIGRIDGTIPHDPATWAFTWRAYLRKRAAWSAPRAAAKREHGGY